MESAPESDDLVTELQAERDRLKGENEKLRASNRRWDADRRTTTRQELTAALG